MLYSGFRLQGLNLCEIMRDVVIKLIKFKDSELLVHFRFSRLHMQGDLFHYNKLSS